MIKYQIFSLIIVSAFFTHSIVCLNLCGDWTQYKDIKCLKVLNKSGTEEEALKSCLSIDQISSLITIHSKEEQEFINNLAENYSNNYDSVWIGMKYTDKVYKWMDGSDTNYTNWANDAVKDGNNPCVQMSLSKATFGKWRDESCKRSSLIVCQKGQVVNMAILKDMIEKMSEEQQKDIYWVHQDCNNSFYIYPVWIDLRFMMKFSIFCSGLN